MNNDKYFLRDFITGPRTQNYTLFLKIILLVLIFLNYIFVLIFFLQILVSVVHLFLHVKFFVKKILNKKIALNLINV